MCSPSGYVTVAHYGHHPIPRVRDGYGGHELRQTLLELDADALGANRASSRPASTTRRGFRLVVVVLAAVILLSGLENLIIDQTRVVGSGGFRWLGVVGCGWVRLLWLLSLMLTIARFVPNIHITPREWPLVAKVLSPREATRVLMCGCGWVVWGSFANECMEKRRMEGYHRLMNE